MSNFILRKQPNEIVPCSIDFKRRIPTGETINAAVSIVKVTDSSGVDKTSTMMVGVLAVSGTIISAVIQAGTDLDDYTITFRAVTTPAVYKFEDEVLLEIRETP
jgi:hypothetical protein